MTIVNAGFDIHRSQITFDALEIATGEVVRGRIDSTPTAVAEWVGRFPEREVHVAVEACPGWYFVVRALESAGAVPHLAEVAETSALRGPKRRAKTDRADALLRVKKYGAITDYSRSFRIGGVRWTRSAISRVEVFGRAQRQNQHATSRL